MYSYKHTFINMCHMVWTPTSSIFSTFNVSPVFDSNGAEQMLTNRIEKGTHLGKSSSCHSSFTSMFSMRRVASVVPIPQRGEQGPAGVRRGTTSQWKLVTTDESWVSSQQAAPHVFEMMAEGRVGIVGGFFCPNNEQFFDTISGADTNAEWSHGFLSPCPQGHMWEACDGSDRAHFLQLSFSWKSNITYKVAAGWNSRGQGGGQPSAQLIPRLAAA